MEIFRPHPSSVFASLPFRAPREFAFQISPFARGQFASQTPEEIDEISPVPFCLRLKSETCAGQLIKWPRQRQEAHKARGQLRRKAMR